ncbi:MAG TPA: pyridoxal phosphate-dependent aminotransferase family protein [Bacillota bacterium]|nr:pyridoxal phosphate-dependent aminotransferase family protein [Bacillota bacterium]HOA15408.1 pyridoxal phosphate-dependent aminotransferase family protein [Bacillota bacterium]HOG52533.1 pyridoxal phosphate-dependent aminotransferase family protein [Bacillota bacterium]
MSAFEDRIRTFLNRIDKMKDEGHYYYLQQVDKMGDTRVMIGGREMIVYSSYNYLGLLHHPHILERSRQALEEWGTGTHGVRVLSGTTRLHNECEDKLAQFMGTEAAIVYSSGFMANLTTFDTLTGRHDLIISDQLAHASIIDGCRISEAEFQRFRHNDVADLERLLKARREQSTSCGIMVVVDAVYSMDGDVCPLPELSDVCRRYDAWLVVDEAHSLGVLGKTGKGILEYFGMPISSIDLLTGSLAKTVPSVGGYVAGSKDVITFLKNNARGFVFSAAVPPAALGAIIGSIEVMETEKWRLDKVRSNIKRFVGGLNKLGYDTLNTQSCVIPIIIGEEELTLELTHRCHEDGMFVSPILPPAVPQKKCRLRANVTAAHTDEDIDIALDILKRRGRELGIIQ